jgi:siderophore synthetase component
MSMDNPPKLYQDFSWVAEDAAREPITPAQEAATTAAIEALLNCYLREGGEWRPVPAASAPEFAEEGDEYLAVIPFADERSFVIAGVRHLSPTHRHRFRMPVKIVMAGGKPWAVSLDTLAGMLTDALGDTGLDDDLSAPGSRGPDPTFLLSRMRQSVATITSFLDARAGEIDELWSADPMSFIVSEQALLLGQMAHPTAQSRWEMSAEQVASYAPETEAQFALQWLAVDPGLVEHDSATGIPAPQLVEELLRDDPAVDGAALDAKLEGLGERVLLPVHPWELEYLRGQDNVAALLSEGLIVELGELGSAVTPTTSVDTVYNAEWPWQLKFSLHVQMTGEMRVTREKELRRAVEAARLAQTEIGEAAAQIAPELVFLQDPAYLAVRHNDVEIDGLSVLLRENRWPADSDADVGALEVLLQDHPHGGRSRLAQIVARLAEESGRSEAEVAREWFGRYLDVMVVSLLRLYLELGLVIQTDRQNTLLELADGWPARGVLRDSQGFQHRAAAHDDIAAVDPGIGEESGAILSEALADERLVTYPILGNALGVVNALGIAGVVDEMVLLGDLHELLTRERQRGGRYPATLLDRLLDDAWWPTRADLLTRLHNGSDMYVKIPNPLHGVKR